MKYQPKGKGKTFKCGNDACLTEYIAKNSLSKYCSAKCRSSACNRSAQEARRDRSERQCRRCLTMFKPSYGDMRKIFCSGDCKAKHWYTLKPGSTHRRRAKKFGCRYDHVDRMIVFERDNWRCYICGKPTPIEKMGTKDHDAPEQEHVIPLSHGGDHCYDNVRCACHSCNAAKAITERVRKNTSE